MQADVVADRVVGEDGLLLVGFDVATDVIEGPAIRRSDGDVAPACVETGDVSLELHEFVFMSVLRSHCVALEFV